MMIVKSFNAALPSFGRKTLSSLMLSALFLVLYNICNYLIDWAGYAGSFCYLWEKELPFIPLMILPYMSLDIFFVCAPFFSKSQSDLSRLEKRIILAIVISCFCFLAVPLKCTYQKPEVSGTLGWIFSNFLKLDKPFNQFPSLHITFSLILADYFRTRTKGILRLSLLVWFGLIMISTLFTYQHHVIDIFGGLLLGAFLLVLFSDRGHYYLNHNAGIAALYLIGGVFLTLIAWILKGWGFIILWPALAVILVGLAYLFSDASIFPKFSYRTALLRHMLFYPLNIAQRLSHYYYAKIYALRSDPWHPLTERVWIGRALFSSEARQAIKTGIGAVIDISGELSENKHFKKLPYLALPVLDLTVPRSTTLFDNAVAFIEKHIPSTIVYIHCKAGFSRTAALAGYWLLKTGRATDAEDAISQIRSARPNIIIRPEVIDFLTKHSPKQLI